MSNIPQTHVYAYLLGGKCHATFHNQITDMQLHVYIKQKTIGVWYVYYNSAYIGYIRGDVFIRNESITRLAPTIMLAAQQFSWVWKQVVAKTLPSTMHVMHDGYCGHCGRHLTEKISLIVGIGPECRKKLGITYSSQSKLELA